MDADLRFDGPKDSALRVALTHGAGAPVDDAFFETLVAALAQRGLRVVRFEFPYMRKRREDGVRRGPDRAPVLLDTWRAVMRELGDPETWVVGGKSMGGRIASMIADEVGARGLACLGYPFHPPGKPEKTRVEHLRTLRTPALFLQGERDPFGSPDEIAGYALSEAIQLHWLGDGDHSLKPRKRSGRSHEDNVIEAAEEIARFTRALSG